MNKAKKERIREICRLAVVAIPFSIFAGIYIGFGCIQDCIREIIEQIKALKTL